MNSYPICDFRLIQIRSTNTGMAAYIYTYIYIHHDFGVGTPLRSTIKKQRRTRGSWITRTMASQKFQGWGVTDFENAIEAISFVLLLCTFAFEFFVAAVSSSRWNNNNLIEPFRIFDSSLAVRGEEQAKEVAIKTGKCHRAAKRYGKCQRICQNEGKLQKS